MLEKIGSTLTQHWRVVAGLVAGLALAIVLANVFLSFQASAVARRVAGALAETAQVEFEDPRASWNGDIEVRSLRITPLGRKRGAILTADRATLHTPGVSWLTRTGLGSAASPLPPSSTLGLSLEGLGVSGGHSWLASADWLGINSGAPFEALGCSDTRRFDVAELAAMGLTLGPGTLEASYSVTSPDTARIVATLSVPGSSHAEHTRDLRLPEPARPLSADPADVAVLEQSWAVRDDGFVQARNRRCAQRARLTRGQFVERHLRVLDHWLAARGLVADRALMAEYGHYASQGGIMKWRSKPTGETTLAELSELPPVALMGALNAAFIANGRRAVAFRFSEFVKPDAAAGDAVAGASDPSAPVTGDATAQPMPADASAVAATAPAEATSVVAEPVPAQADDVAQAPAPVASAPAPEPPVSPPPPGAASTEQAPAVAAAPPPAAPASGAASEAASEPAKPAEPTAAAPKPAPPAVLRPGPVEYEQLEKAEGRQIALKTIYGSRRTGTLVDYNRRALTLRLPMREGSVPLTVPRETIASLELLDN